MIIGGRIKSRLKDRGISQAELGRRVGLTQSTINGLIKGEQEGTTKLHQIARELRTTPAFLVGETDDPGAEHPDLPLMSAKERDLLEWFRKLETDDQAMVTKLVQKLARCDPRTLHSPKKEYRAG